MQGYLNEERFEKIIEFLCQFKRISKAEMITILKDKELKYLLFLLLKKYKCDDPDRLGEELFLKSKKSLSYNMRRAEEKFFVNKEFREMYFTIEELIEKII